MYIVCTFMDSTCITNRSTCVSIVQYIDVIVMYMYMCSTVYYTMYVFLCVPTNNRNKYHLRVGLYAQYISQQAIHRFTPINVRNIHVLSKFNVHVYNTSALLNTEAHKGRHSARRCKSSISYVQFTLCKANVLLT